MHVLAALLGLLAHCGKHKSDSGLMAALVIDETLNNVKLKNSHKISRIIDFFVTRSLNIYPKTLVKMFKSFARYCILLQAMMTNTLFMRLKLFRRPKRVRRERRDMSGE